MHFTCEPFDYLTLQRLYAIMALRQEVFVVEQNCPYLDADGKDIEAWHLSGWLPDGRLGAYARLLPPGLVYEAYPAIGRIVSAPAARGAGLGRALVQQAIEECYRLFGYEPIRIGAQLYLLEFYQSFGFEPVGDEYLEDGIPHIEMVLPPPAVAGY